MLEIRNCDKYYKKIKALNNVSIKFENPGLYILLGENGSGKSTILKLLARVIYKNKGEVINKELISYLPEKFSMPKLMKVKAYVDNLLRIFRSDKRTEDLLELYLIPNKRIGELSKGNLQKLAILQALENNVNYYLLDEPIDGLDIYAKKLFKEIIIELLSKNKTVIMSLHNKTIFNDLKPKVIKIKEGKLDVKKRKV